MNNPKRLNIDGEQCHFAIAPISWKGGSCHSFLAKNIVSAVGLKRGEHKSLIFFYDKQSGLLCGFTDKELEQILKPRILELRKRASQFILSNKLVEEPQLDDSTYTTGESK